MAPFDQTEGDAAWLLAFVIAMVVMVMLSRLDHRLARYAAYYWPRHFVRLALFAILAMRSFVQHSKVLPGPGEELFSLFLLQFRENQVFILAVIVSMHFLLWKAGWLRRFWHRRLEVIGLRGQTEAA